MDSMLLVGWYIFCGVLIVAVLGGMRWLTHSRFRDDVGDKTTEVGYEEDSVGHDLRGAAEPTNDFSEEPHVSDASAADNASLG